MCTCNQCSHICTSPPRARRVHSVTHYVVVEIVTPARGGTGRREINDRLTDTRPQSCPVSGQSSDMVERVPECWESPRFRLPSGSLRSGRIRWVSHPGWLQCAVPLRVDKLIVVQTNGLFLLLWTMSHTRPVSTTEPTRCAQQTRVDHASR